MEREQNSVDFKVESTLEEASGIDRRNFKIGFGHFRCVLGFRSAELQFDLKGNKNLGGG